MDSVDETLRRAREVEERYKQFLERKVEQDRSIEETFKKIEKTQSTLKETKETIGSIDKLYTRLEEVLSESINAAVNSVAKHALFNIAEAGFKPNRVDPKKVAEMLKDKKRILVLTGAGMSAASGIPTFRGAGGFWKKDKVEVGSEEQSEKVEPETILTYRFYKEKPKITWAWLHNFYNLKIKAKPNKGHVALNDMLEELMRRGKQVCMVTQNIDNLHVEAQEAAKKINKNYKGYPIYEIHGNIMKIRCDNCTHQNKALNFQPYQRYIDILNDGKQVRCPRCQHPLRPHIMFFDETYEETINRCDTIRSFVKEADAILVIGTALQTGLAFEIVQSFYEDEKQIVEMNTACEIMRSAVWWVEDKAENSLEQIKAGLGKK